MDKDSSRPRLLLVEDDPISASFLADALSSLPAVVDVAGDIAQAVAIAREQVHALWLVDAHLPDGDGRDCLLALRAIHATPALAITAGASNEELDGLCACGFIEVLPKPVPVAMLLASVGRALDGPRAWVREPAPGKLPAWDEARALAALGGNHDALQALRKMFLAELPVFRGQLAAAHSNADAAAIRAVLHKLKAGCGFVGAARMAQAVDSLADAPLDAQARQRLEFAMDDLLGQPAAED